MAKKRVGGTTTGDRLKRRRAVYAALVAAAGHPSSLDIQSLATELEVDKSTIYRDLSEVRKELKDRVTDKDALDWVAEIEATFEYAIRQLLGLYVEAGRLSEPAIDEAGNVTRDALPERSILIRRWVLQDITRVVDDRIRIGQAIGIVPKATDKIQVGVDVDIRAHLETFFVEFLGEVSESERQKLQGLLAGRLAALDAGGGALGARPSAESDGTPTTP